MNKIRHWYKDRDFPEIKVSNSEILASLDGYNSSEQCKALIEEHNFVVDEVYALTQEGRQGELERANVKLANQNAKFREALEMIAKSWRMGDGAIAEAALKDE